MTKCTDCPLFGSKQVNPFINLQSKVIFVGPGPTVGDLYGNHYLGGYFGRLISHSFTKSFSGGSKIPSILCRADKKLKKKEINKAIECCKDRVIDTINQHTENPVVIASGDAAFYQVYGKQNCNPFVGDILASAIIPNTVVPVFSILNCLNKPALIPVFKYLIRRACLLSTGNLKRDIFPQSYIKDPYSKPIEHFFTCTDYIGIDVETAGLDPFSSKLLCIGFGCTHYMASISYPILDKSIELSVRKLLQNNTTIKKTFHNGQHDILTLESNGFNVNNYSFDTLIAHSVTAPQLKHDLGTVAAIETTLPRWKTDYKIEAESKDAERFSLDSEELRSYNAKDSFTTSLLSPRLEKNIKTTHRGYELFNTSMELAKIAMHMRKHGILVDTTAFNEHRIPLTKRIEENKELFSKLVPKYQLGKNAQHKDLKNLFFNDLKCKPIKFSDKTGEPQLDSFTLEQFVSYGGIVTDIARLLLKIRGDTKLLAVYIDGLPMDSNHIVHSIWKIHGAITGRWSSSSPNLQNIPKIMRNLYIPRPGFILCKADYSQLELRIAALQSQDKYFVDWYNNGIDVHKEKAREFFGKAYFDSLGPKEQKVLRNQIKSINYGIIYGGDPETLWRAVVVDNPGVSLKLVREFHKQFYEKHTDIKQWQLKNLQFAHENGYIEEPLSGRREYFYDGKIDNNQVLNFPVQAMAGTIANRAMIGVNNDVDWKNETILLQVHDEIAIETKNIEKGVDILRRNMTQCIELNGKSMTFPVEISAGYNWRDAKEVL